MKVGRSRLSELHLSIWTPWLGTLREADARAAFPPQALPLAMLILSLSQLRLPALPPAFVTSLLAASRRRLPQSGPRELAAVVMGLQRLGCDPGSEFVTAFVDAAGPRLEDFNPKVRGRQGKRGGGRGMFGALINGGPMHCHGCLA
jgi:hypothetical protein